MVNKSVTPSQVFVATAVCVRSFQLAYCGLTYFVNLDEGYTFDLVYDMFQKARGKKLKMQKDASKRVASPAKDGTGPADF